jgi:hypothetical protein
VNARSTVTSIALVVLAAATAAYAYLVDRGTVSDSDRAGRRTDVFPSFRVAEVTRVEIAHDSEPSLVLERDADAGGASSWTMTSPRHERADSAAVDMLLRELELATRLREVGANDAAGLDAPRAWGKVQVGKLEYRFALGGDAPRPEGAAYMRIDGEGTFVVARSLKVQLLRGADAYRDRTLLAYGASGMARVEVRAASEPGRDPGTSFTLEREGATFRVAGKGLRASRAAADRLMAALANGRAESFVDDAAADRSTASPVFTIVVTPRDAAKERVELRIGGECPGQPEDVVIVRTTPARVSACTARALVEALGTTGTALVDTSPFYAHADEIEDLRLEPVGAPLPGAGTRVEAARRGMGWHERAPEDRELTSDETDSANSLALALAQSRGTDVHHAGADDHFEPRARVTVMRTGGGASEVVELSATGSDGTALVRRADDGALLRVTRAVARRFAPHPVALRARSLWQAPFDAGSVVAVEDTCGPTAQRLELRDHTWVMRSPAGLPADAVSVADLVGTLAHAKAEAWLTEADDGGFGFEGPGACTVTLTLDATASSADAGARRVSITFGAAGDGGFYARTLDEPAVFVGSPGLREVLSHPAIDRARFHLDPGGRAAVVVVHDGIRHVVSADAGDDKLAIAMAGLYAQSALHAGPAAPDEGMGRPVLEITATTRSDGGALSEMHIAVGAETEVDGAAAYFARAAGVDATFAVPKARVTAILDAL